MTILPETSWRRWPQTLAMVQALEAMGAQACFVGGCVRDALMGREAQDVDLATPLLPEAVTEGLQRAGIQVVPTGLAHGTVTAIIDHRPFEITTLRRDMETDGRHATVSFTDSWRDDAARRDFTINALYADMEGGLHDYFGGLDDLRARQVRFIGDARARIEEDGLRILRYFRFQAQLGFHGDAHALEACAAHAPMIARLSGERIQQEMRKLLGAAHMTDALLLQMQDCALYPFLFDHPDAVSLHALQEVEAEAAQAPHWRLRLAFLLHQMPQNATAFVPGRWKLSNADAAHLKALLAAENRIAPGMPEAEWKKTIRRLGKPLAVEALLLAWAEALQRGAVPAEGLHDACKAMLHIAETWTVPVFPVSGRDLLAAGISEGAELGKALKALEAQWEESGYCLSKETLINNNV